METNVAEIKLTLEKIPSEMTPEKELELRDEAYRKLDAALDYLFSKPLDSSLNP